MDPLPHWEPGTAAVLCVPGPHAIPVSTAIRADDHRAPLNLLPSAVALELVVERLTDHLADGRTEMLGPPTWRWLDDAARAGEPEVLSELLELAVELREAPPAG